MSTSRHAIGNFRNRLRIPRFSASIIIALVATLLTTAAPVRATVFVYYPFNTNGIPGSGDATFTNNYLVTATIGPNRSVFTNYNVATAMSFVAGTNLSAQGGAPSGSAVTDNNWVGNTNYFQFTFNASGLRAIVVNYDLARSNTGPVTNQFQYSADGGATFTVFTNIFNTLGGSVFMAFTNELSTLKALDNNPNVVFRIVGTGSPAAGGTMRVDNFTIGCDPAYIFTTLAGLAAAGSADGTGSAARFNFPFGVAVDGSGNVYVADTDNNTIRKITSAGAVSTLAGLAGSFGSADGSGSAARFNSPTGVAVDGSGNVYVADNGNHTIRKITSAGVVTTLAGLAGSSGSADGTGSAARFNQPTGVAVDGSGNIYVADQINRTIRKITSAGAVSTLAGLAGSFGSTDGTGSAARFNQPTGVAVDGSGNLYVADYGNNTIRKITSAGVVSTMAGSAGVPGSADGTGSAARFNFPFGVAVDGSGNVYVADTDNNTIRKITSAGAVSTLAGLAGSSGSADGTGSAARFNGPFGVAVDGSGNVYVADEFNNTIRKGSPQGSVPYTGNGDTSFGGAIGTGSLVLTDNGATLFGTLSRGVGSFNDVLVIYIDSVSGGFSDTSGFSDNGDGLREAISGFDGGANRSLLTMPAAGVVSTLAGLAGNSGTLDGTGAAARFNQPAGVAVDSAGNIYVADVNNKTIRKITPGGVVSTLAGSPGLTGSADGTGSSARFGSPNRVAVDVAGNLYVADTVNNTIRKVTPGGVVSTLAGLAGSPGSADGTGAAARFNQPAGVAVDSAGNVYVADFDNATIRKVTPGGVVSTLAGLAGSHGSADGTGSSARFTAPNCVTVGSDGNIYVTDSGNETIRKITPGGVVSTLAGSAGVPGSADGTGSAARFDFPIGIAVDAAGNLYVADAVNDTVRKITSVGVVSTLAGSAGLGGSADGTGSAARFNAPNGVAVDSAGNVYVADSGNSTIRKIPTVSFLADYAMALNPANESFGGLWQLANGGGNSLNFITSANLTPTGTATAPSYTFSINFSQLGLPANPPAGTTIKLIATYISDTGFRSDETDLGSLTGTVGWNPFTGTSFATYVIEDGATSGIDIGLRMYDGDGLVKIAAESGTLTSPLRIYKNGTTYGIILVDPSSPNASRLRIRTSEGTKSLEKLP